MLRSYIFTNGLKNGILLILFFIIHNISPLHAQPYKTGLALQGSYWDIQNQNGISVIHENLFNSSVEVGNFGGRIIFFSRLNDHLFMEFSFGATAYVHTQSFSLFEEVVYVKNVIPILTGIRYNLLPVENTNDIQPYLSVGGGPYLELHVNSTQYSLFHENTSTKTELFPGFYIGGGLFCAVSDGFGFECDMKYHMFNLDVDHDNSGVELGFGIVFMWGRYE